MRRRLLCLASLLLASTLAIASARAETVLRVGTGGAFTSIDPHYHNLTPNNVIADTLFSTLVTLDGNFKPVPALAESWKAVDDHTWEFKLRPGVKFSDGTPFTPDDVVFSFQRIPTVLNSPSSFNYAVKPVERIEIVDPLTIRLHTKQPEPLLPYLLNGAHIVSRKYGEGASTADYNSGKAAIGTGPYKLQSVLLGDRIVFVRNENYWGPKPYWDRVDYRMIPNDASRTAAVQAGDVDIIDQVSTRDVATLKKSPALDILSPAGQRLIYIYLDAAREQTPNAFDLDGKKLAKNPLQDVKVRKALSLAINRDGIKTQIMDGYSVPTGQLLPPGAAGYTPDLKPDPYDPAQAKKLLAEAGYPNGFALTLNGPNDRYVNDGAIVAAIAQMWTRIGVKTAVATSPASVFFAGAVKDDYTTDLTGWASDTGEASSSLIQICASTNPEKGRGAIVRPSHFADAKEDQLVEQSIATFDPEEREKLYIDATKLCMAQQAVLPIHHQVNIYAMRKGFALAPRMQEGIRIWEVSRSP